MEIMQTVRPLHQSRTGVLLSKIAFLAAALTILLPAASQGGTPLVSGFSESVFVSDSSRLTFPTALAWAPDGSGRLFVTRYHGRVEIIKDGILQEESFTKVDPIYSNGEGGVLGLCFDPNFIENGYVYFFVAVSRTEQQIIRYRDVGGVGTDKTIIISNLPTLGNQHNGGAIGIGPDGKLYWAIGDNGKRVGVDSDLLSLASKVGRANLDGTAPSDNPFHDGSGPNNDYIWARGFRNPFAMTFHPVSGKMWLSVVGNACEQIFVVGPGDHGGWDQYEASQPGGFLSPVIRYRTNRSSGNDITREGLSRQDNVVTVKTFESHSLLRGATVEIRGANDASFNGTFAVLSVIDEKTVTLSQEGPDETSGDGSLEAKSYGGCVIGGTFYESTAFPSEYRSNFFFGDYVSGRLMRAVVDAGENVNGISPFAEGIGQFIDVATGPDGALYYMGHNEKGIIYRLSSDPAASKLIVYPTALRVANSGKTRLSVSLSGPPSGGSVQVQAIRLGGSDHIEAVEGSTLLFDAGNWSIPQTITIAAEDHASEHGAATFAIGSPAFDSQSVLVQPVVSDTPAIILSKDKIELQEGESTAFTVRLSQPPASLAILRVTPSSGNLLLDILTGSTLFFTPENFDVPQTVTIQTAKDSDSQPSSGEISISGAGIAARLLSMTITDVDQAAPAITSQPPASALAGVQYQYQVSASGEPAPTFSLVESPEGMSINTKTGLISWTPSATGQFTIQIRADNGVSPEAVQTFSLTVKNDTPPTAIISKPVEDEIVSGRNTEWFGDGVDDVGTVKAEFYIDGTLVYTDVNSEGHYHIGGSHLKWDTTLLSNGPHLLKMVVHDTKGQTGEATVNVVVKNQPANQPPAVSLKSPAADLKFGASGTIILEASASDADGTVEEVAFFANETKLGVVSAAPYIFAWKGAAPGTHSVTARALDNLGAATSSDPRLIEVIDVAGYEGDVSPRPNGDQDGSVTLTDWVQVGRFVTGLDDVGDNHEFVRIDCAPRETAQGLIKGDGALTLLDWVQAGRYAAGLDSTTPSGGPAAVSLSSFASAHHAQLRSLPDLIERILKIKTAKIEVGNSGWVSVEINARGNENALGFTVKFDTDKLRYVQSRTVGAAEGSILIVNDRKLDKGTLGIAIALTIGHSLPQGNQPVVELLFEPVTNQAEDVLLSFTDDVIKREIVDNLANALPVDFVPGIVSVEAGNRPPVAEDDAVEVAPDETARITASRLLANDHDPDDDALSISSVSPQTAQMGTVELSGSSLFYSPPSGFTGFDSFTYEISDGLGGVDSGVVTVEVTIPLPPMRSVTARILSNGNAQIEFIGIPSRVYEVQVSTNLADWTPIGTATVGSDGIFSFEDSGAQNQDVRFYRIVKPQP